MLSNFFTSLGSALTSFVEMLVKMIVDLFKGLFCTVGEEGAITGITPIAEIAIVFIAIGMVYKMLPTVIGWFRLRSRTGRKAKRKAK